MSVILRTVLGVKKGQEDISPFSTTVRTDRWTWASEIAGIFRYRSH